MNYENDLFLFLFLAPWDPKVNVFYDCFKSSWKEFWENMTVILLLLLLLLLLLFGSCSSFFLSPASGLVSVC